MKRITMSRHKINAKKLRSEFQKYWITFHVRIAPKGVYDRFRDVYFSKCYNEAKLHDLKKEFEEMRALSTENSKDM